MSDLGDPTPELLALASALGGIAPPCRTTDPDVWFADPGPAIRLCRTGCHALNECAALAAANEEKFGVWGGVDLTRQHPQSQRQEAR